MGTLFSYREGNMVVMLVVGVLVVGVLSCWTFINWRHTRANTDRAADHLRLITAEMHDLNRELKRIAAKYSLD